jgi:methionyl-tRNA formyltransferase
VKVVFLAADDPLYLPDFFERILAAHAAETAAVFVTPALYKRQTPGAAAWRYFRTFGPGDTLRLVARVATARLRGRSIEAVCRKHRVPCSVTRDVNAPDFLERLRSLAPDLVVSVSCPQIFQEPLIAIPKRGLLNVHGAILPHYRGVMPGFWMLANGEQSAGVSVHYVVPKIDAGDLCGQEVFDIRPGESLDAFLRRSKRIGADLLLEVLESIRRGTTQRRPIEPGVGSYHSWPDREAVRAFRAAGRSVG